MASSAATPLQQIPAAYGAFEIFARDEEEQADEKMPKTVGHALLLLMASGESESTARCRDCMDKYLQILAAGPSGSLTVNVGQACLCWGCGFVGIPSNTDALEAEATDDPVRKKMPPFAVCKHCGSDDKTNFIIGKSGDSPLPFIETSSPAP